MTILFAKPKLIITLIGVGIALTILIVSLQINLTAVSAVVIPIVVYEDHLDFGTVFPGEHRSGNFIINIAEGYEGDGVNYQIIQKIKPLPGIDIPEGYESTSQYCQQNPNDFSKCYRNLCPSLDKINNEVEGDTESQAVVGGLNDPSDTWIIDFNVPAILGYVAQDHVYEIVATSGEYGCDISINIPE